MRAYCRVRRGEARQKGRRKRAWPKLTAVLHTGSHLILGAVTNTGLTQDSPDFTPAMRQATALLAIDTVLTDAAYDAEHSHALSRALGVRESVFPIDRRNPGRRWPTTLYCRGVRRRWSAERGFSRHTRRLGSALTARAPPAPRRELVLRVLTHTLVLLGRRAQRPSTQQCLHWIGLNHMRCRRAASA